MSRSLLTLCLLMAVLMMFACGKQEPVAPELSQNEEAITLSKQSDLEAAITALLDEINAELEAEGSNIRAAVVEYLTAEDEVGRTVFFSDVGNKQLGHHFVPGDPRRAAWSGTGPGDDITWASDQVEGDAGPGLSATQTAIDNAMGTWQGVNCSTIPLSKVAAAGNVGIIPLFFGLPGNPNIAADITHAGFGTVMDPLLPPPIIAATFTLIFVDPSQPGSPPTDIDNNGKLDTALREIYYTFNFPWGINTNFPIDVETVVLHEAGHGLSQAHFGTLFQTDANGKFHFSPRAVMNAGYTGVQQDITATDNGGHCSIWGSWPNN